MLSGSVVLRFWEEVDTTLSLLHKKYAIPRPIQAPPPCTLVDCCVVEVGDRAVWSNSSAWSQIATSILPPPAKTIVQNPLIKTMPPRHLPALPAPAPAFIS
jgi:hypothetical protein